MSATPASDPHWMRSVLAPLIACTLLLAVTSHAHGQTLYWDADTVTTAAQEGGGTWNTSSTNWLPTASSASSANTNWPVSGSTTTAVFSSGTNTTANNAITVSGTINAAGLVFATSSSLVTNYSYTFSGGTLALADNAAIEIQGTAAANTSGFLTFNSSISGNNITLKKTGGSVGYIQLGTSGKAWTGTLTLDSTAGDLFLRTNHINNINTLTSLVVMSASTVSVNAGGTYTPSWTIVGTGTAGRGAIRFDATSTLSGNITLNDNATILMNVANITGTLNGNIGESVASKALTLSAGSIAGTTIALGGSNTFTGGLIITSGTVRLDNVGALNASSPNLVTFGNSAQSKTLSLNGKSVTAAGLTVAGGTGASIVQNASSTASALTLQVSGSNSYSYSGTLVDGTGGGALSIVKSGTGTQILSGTANTYTGGTTLNAGILNIAADNSLGAVPSALDADNLLFNGGTLQLAATITLDSNRGVTLGTNGGTIDTNSFNGFYGGVISGTGSLAKNGAGTLSLTSANSYSGVTTVNAGILSVQHNLALGSTATGTIIANGGKLDLRNGVTVTGESLITPYLVSGAGTNTWAGSVQVSVGSTLTFESEAGSHLVVSGTVNGADTGNTLHTFNILGDGTGEISGAISNTISLVKNGTGTWTLSGNNTFTSSMTLTQGTLVIGNTGAFNASTPVGVAFSGNTNTKTLRLNGYSIVVSGLSAATGTGTTVDNGAAANATLTVRNTSTNTYAGVLANGSGAGTLALIKEGSSTLVLTGANTYTGNTRVNQGTLQLNFSASAAPASSIIHSSSALKLGGGTLLLSGGSTTANSQTFNGLELISGSSTITLTTNATAQNLVLNLAAITRTGGSVNFVLPSGTQSSVNGITTTTGNNASGILGAWATVSGTSWAANDGSGNIIAYTAYTDVTNFGSGSGAQGPIPNTSTANIRIINGGTSGNVSLTGTGTTTVNTLLMSATTAATIGSGTSGETLRLGASGGILLPSTAGSLTIGTAANDGSILTAGGADNTAGDLVITNNASVSAVTVHSNINNNGSGVVSLVKNGVGTLALTSQLSTYSGGTSINGGTVLVSGDRSLGIVPGTVDSDNITLSGGTLQWGAAFNLNSNRGITLGTAGGTLDNQTFATSYSGSITGDGALTKNGTGMLTLTAANTYTGVTTISTGAVTITHNQALGSSAGGTVMGGAAGLILGNNVTVTGESVSITGNYTTNNYGNLQSAAGTVGSPVTATWAGPVLLAGSTARVGADNNSTLVISGVIQDSGFSTLNISAAASSGTVTLSGANTYTGPTNVIRGTLKTGLDNTLPATTVLTLHNLDTITDFAGLNLLGHSQTIAGLASAMRASPSSTNRTEITSSTAATLTVNQATASTYYGQITGSISLVKQGVGTLTLVNQTGATSNSFSGKTTISGGTLALSGAGNLDGTPWIQIDTGATLDVSAVTGGSYTFSNKQLSGRGSVTGNLVVGGTSTVTPGNGTESATIANVGSLTFNGNLTLQSTSSTPRLTLQLGGLSAGSFDTIDVNGTLTVQDNTLFSVEWTNGYEATAGTTFDLLDWNSVIWGNFNPASETYLDLPTLTNSVLYWDVSDFLSSGVVRIAAVPEPSRILLLTGGLLAGLARRRRAGW